MKVYQSNGNGCLVLVIIATILVMTLGFFGKILFTTPLGIVLLIGFGVKYILDQRKLSSTNSTFTQGNDHNEFDSESYTQDDDEFDRSDYLDVEVVDDYKDVDN